jgi:peptidoglycan/LPS O-acetylase OafA/YrhL
MIPKGRQTWLDGLRGIAAAIVAWLHFTSGEMATPYRSFWDEPAELNRRWIQLPPFRILFAGQAMVSLFFVVSGYSISMAILRYRDADDKPLFYRKLTSSVFRRGFRLYLPLLAVYLISHTVFYVGLYNWQFGEYEGCPAAKPWGNPIPHWNCFFMSFMTTFKLAEPFKTGGLNAHFWTIYAEFQGSLALYTTILGLATTKPAVRLGVVSFFCLVFTYFGQNSLLCFYAGLSLAEIDAREDISSFSLEPKPTKRRNRTFSILKKITSLTFFAFGIYLLCLPYDDKFPADYAFQTWMKLSFWVGPFIRTKCWYAIGAVLVVATLRHHPLLRLPLESKLAQYLGKISFSLYLIHPIPYRILRNYILEAVCRAIWKKGFWATRGDEGSLPVVVLAWICTTAVVMPILFVCSNYMTVYVDQGSIGMAHRLEKLVELDPGDGVVLGQRRHREEGV